MPENRSKLLLTLLIIAAVALRLWNNDKMSFFGDYDEYYTAKTVVGIYETKIGDEKIVDLAALHSSSATSILADANRDNGNSFLYNYLLHFYSSAFGHTDFAMRSFSAIFDVISILLIWLIGKRLKIANNRILLACTMFAFFPVFVNYSGIIRTYSFTTCVGILLFYLILKVRENGSRIKDILLIGITATALFLGHFLTYYILGVLFVYFLLTFKTDKHRHTTILGGLSVAAVLCGAFLLFNLSNLSNFAGNSERYRNLTTKSADEGNLRKLEAVNLVTLTPKTILYFDQFYTGNTYALKWVSALTNETIMLICGAALLLLPILLLLFIEKNHTDKKWIRLWFWLIIAGHLGALALVFISGHMISLGIKYTMFSIPFYVMLVCFYTKNNWLTRTSLFVIIAGSLFTDLGAIPAKGNKPIQFSTIDSPTTYRSSESAQVLEQLKNIVTNSNSDTLYVHSIPELILIEMSGIEKKQKVAYILLNDTTGLFANKLLPFRFKNPD